MTRGIYWNIVCVNNGKLATATIADDFTVLCHQTPKIFSLEMS